MTKNILYLILLVLGSLGVAMKFSTSHEKMPIGCDEFGYLNMSKAFTEARAFHNHTDRPYISKLLDTLRKSKITENEIAYMVTPHAYHVIPETDKIINQYPPGTSTLLTIIPIEFRQLTFPLLVIALFVLFTMFALKLSHINNLTLLDLIFPSLIFIMMVSAPFTTELSRINSLAPTFGLLFAAGLLLQKKPFVSLFLIAVSINFRIANLIMLIPAGLFLPFANIFNSQYIKSNLKIALRSFGIVTIALLPLLIYNFLLTGNPFAATYSDIDQQSIPISNLLPNIKFYFNFDQRWFRIQLLVLFIGIVLVGARKINSIDFLKFTSFLIANYLFFIFHAVKMDYYPYASAMILLGILAGVLAEINISNKFHILTKVIFLVTTLLIFITGMVRYLKKDHIDFEESKLKYQALCNYDVVWGDLYSGTSEYVCGNSGFRYGTTTPRARKTAIEFLKNNNYTQIILLNDNTIDSKTIIREIAETGLSYQIQSDSYLGDILIIK